MSKPLPGVIHGRMIELADDPGLSDGAQVIVELRASGSSSTRGPALEEVLGLWQSEGEFPDDVECRRILDEELLRTHSP